MNEKTRQLYFRFLEFLAETDFEDLERAKLQELELYAENYLIGTELHNDAVSRVQNAIRFLDASEHGAAVFEIKSLLTGVERRIRS